MCRLEYWPIICGCMFWRVESKCEEARDSNWGALKCPYRQIIEGHFGDDSWFFANDNDTLIQHVVLVKPLRCQDPVHEKELRASDEMHPGHAKFRDALRDIMHKETALWSISYGYNQDTGRVESVAGCDIRRQIQEGDWVQGSKIWGYIMRAENRYQTVGSDFGFIFLRSKQCQNQTHGQWAAQYAQRPIIRAQWPQVRELVIDIVKNQTEIGQGTRGYNPQNGRMEDLNIPRDY
ncbi:hypothetical protein BT63DRAFT_461353 [Microthyrium microscopicum]|uniref:Uncharacterized protein n=1 Tax=Microthyrium microscopicum TaxID=703497 RepID=A0A6A6TV93_9PEZI|nr:hypothetical protein BT63DRAFT_461353 [Microthyrium microscopicum]